MTQKASSGQCDFYRTDGWPERAELEDTEQWIEKRVKETKKSEEDIAF